MKKYTEKEIVDRIKQLGLRKELPKDYWICGVRSNADAPDKFDDRFYLFQGEKLIKETTGTTNPGLSILTGGFLRFNKAGAFVAKTNEWYEGLWKFGFHMGKIKALRQVRAIKGYRDGNKNSKAEEIGNIISGLFGINFHPATYKLAGLIRVKIGGWSAGCQVANNDNDYDFIIETVKGQSAVSYCLLKEF